MTEQLSAASPRLTTPRLTLRPPIREHAAVLARLADDIEVARMTTSIPYPYEVDMAEGFIARMEKRDARRETVLALETPGDGFVGLIGFHPNDTGATEIGYWLGKPYWGQGYMTEAVQEALVWASGPWGKRFIMSGHFADNPASGQVLVKTGFLYTGDVLPRYSMARGETAPTRMMVWLA